MSRPLPPDKLITWMDNRGHDAEGFVALETLTRHDPVSEAGSALR